MSTLTGTRRLATWATAGVFGAGALTGVVLSQTGLASADSSSTTPSTGSSSPSTAQNAPGPRPHHGAWGLPGRTLHGEATVLDKDGDKHQVEFWQGKAAVSGGSITVTNEDGTSPAYTSGDDTKVFLDGQETTLDKVDGKDVRVTVVDGTLRRVVSGRPPHPLRDHVATGTVAKVNASSITITTPDGDKTFAITDKTRIVKDGRQVPIGQIKQGDRVHVPFVENSDGSDTALGIVEGRLPRDPGPGGPSGPGHFGGFGAPDDEAPQPTQTS